jgi:hypothetical protein
MGDSVTRNGKLLLLMTGLIAVAIVLSACDLKLPVDCSFIHQPDSGGLVCLGANAIGISLGLLALLAALVIGVGSVVAH